MNPSEFNKRISLMRNEINDIEGRQISNWKELKDDIWAKKLVKSGKEYLEAAAVNAENEVVFQVRRPRLFKYKESDRIKYESEDYEIKSILDVKFNPNILEIHCKVISNG